MMFGGFLLVILIVGFVGYLLVGPGTLCNLNLGGGRSGAPSRSMVDGDRDTALSILKQRYARGEITTKAYRDMRRALQEEEGVSED